MKAEFEDYVKLQPQGFEDEEFPARIEEYMTEDMEPEKIQRMRSQGRLSSKLKQSQIPRVINNESQFQSSNQMYNLGNLKNVLTSIYPNLQKPNIMKA